MVPLGAACLLLATACGTGGETADDTVVETERVVVTERETVVTTPPPDDDRSAGDDRAGDDGSDGRGQPFPADTARDRGQAAGEPLTLVDVRVGRHDGYDRVTFEFAGDGTPGWIVGYTDDPRAQGSGRPVDVDGESVLGSSIRPVAPPTDADAYDGPDRIEGDRLRVIDEVVLGVTYEADLGAFIGIGERVPFRAQRFSDPPRVVIDVVHPARTG